MKAQELRIGNKLLLLGEICTIECISNLPKRKDMYWIKTKEFIDTKIIHFKPIPLTEERLLKFGFVKKEGWDDQEYYELNGFKVFIIGSGFEFEYEDTALKFVHRLQNLYYEIKDQELTLKQI